MQDKRTLQIQAKSDREIVVTRVFDAPRELVFEALTTPALVKRWLGVFADWTMPVCEMDLKVGGTYRWVWQGSGGKQMGVRGVFREITPPARIVSTERFDEAWYPGEGLVTSELAEANGKTTLTMTMRYESRAARDAVLASPMEHGLAASYDALAAILTPHETRGERR